MPEFAMVAQWVRRKKLFLPPLGFRVRQTEFKKQEGGCAERTAGHFSARSWKKTTLRWGAKTVSPGPRWRIAGRGPACCDGCSVFMQGAGPWAGGNRSRFRKVRRGLVRLSPGEHRPFLPRDPVHQRGAAAKTPKASAQIWKTTSTICVRKLSRILT